MNVYGETESQCHLNQPVYELGGYEEWKCVMGKSK